MALTNNETRPPTQQEGAKKSKLHVISMVWLRSLLARSNMKESYSFTKTENSSSDSGKQQDGNHPDSHRNIGFQGSMRERFFRFQSQKSAEKNKIERRKRRRARKALRMISFILGAFVICWSPYHIIIIIKGFCDIPSEGYSCINDHLYNFAYYMCYMNSPINPFCYAMANIAFKRAFIRILKGDLRIKWHPPVILKCISSPLNPLPLPCIYIGHNIFLTTSFHICLESSHYCNINILLFPGSSG